ncbi:hypothetical protein HAX54_039656 [Datura stramonium]|uniref:Uncharacterized protein n=1 Tax=Datura stramonium TaxID=4076 RepID=A0ABS8SJ41_DATST|nr:hypothetical protein [Datura stramonium]
MDLLDYPWSYIGDPQALSSRVFFSRPRGLCCAAFCTHTLSLSGNFAAEENDDGGSYFRGRSRSFRRPVYGGDVSRLTPGAEILVHFCYHCNLVKKPESLDQLVQSLPTVEITGRFFVYMKSLNLAIGMESISTSEDLSHPEARCLLRFDSKFRVLKNYGNVLTFVRIKPSIWKGLYGLKLWVNVVGLVHDDCISKMRLMSLVDLGLNESSQIPYSVIKETLIDDTEVESWVVKAITISCLIARLIK